jgi:SecD/SecF fusion protein
MAAQLQRSTVRKLIFSAIVFFWALLELLPFGGAGCTLRRGLDLRGGLSVTLEISPRSLAEDGAGRRLQLEQVQEVMRRRIDGLGIAEPLIHSRGDSQVEVQLAGVFRQDRPDLVDAIRKPAKLEFRLVHPASGTEKATPVGYEWISAVDGGKEDRATLVRRIPELTGRSVRRAAAVVNQYGGYEISLELTADGAKKFARVTEENVGHPLAIILDGKMYSAPVIRSTIRDGRASISGHFTQKEALALANVLNNPLEFELQVVEACELGPTLAEDARTSALRASICGAMLVVLFMVGFYGLSGFAAVLSLLFNGLIVLGGLAMLGATLTLSGIAAFVLTIGMAVDSNILVFSRIREELHGGRPLAAALAGGFSRALSTILDANLTTFLAAVILIASGTGSVRGFGIVLAIGIGATLLCTLVFFRGILEVLVHGLGIQRLFPEHRRWVGNFDFLRRRRRVQCFAWVAVAAGLCAVAVRGRGVWGIDFTGGDEMLLAYAEKPPLRGLYAVAEREKIGDLQVAFRKSLADGAAGLKVQTSEGRGDAFFDAAVQEFPNSQLQLLQRTTVGGSVGAAIRWNALLSLLLSLGGILAYVAFRFERGFAVGAIVSTVHDVLISIGIYAILGHKFSAPMVASVLMIVGYSINDTIVIFDRIREELPRNPNFSLAQVINLSINRTLSRTLLTSLTTFLAAGALFVFGAGVMVDIARIFLIGIVAGTFSSIFIASPIFYRWHRGERGRLDQILLAARSREI